MNGDWHGHDLSHGRIERLVANLRGGYLGDADTVIRSPGSVQRPRLRPHSPGLADRVWYGGGRLQSARWAAERGPHLLTGDIVTGGRSDDFGTAQLDLVRTYRELAETRRSDPRIALGRVIVPLDGADRSTRARYREFAASRHDRTLKPQGEKRTLFAPDLVGRGDEILERLHADPVVTEVTELRLELPYEFDRSDTSRSCTTSATPSPRGWAGDRSPTALFRSVTEPSDLGIDLVPPGTPTTPRSR